MNNNNIKTQLEQLLLLLSDLAERLENQGIHRKTLSQIRKIVIKIKKSIILTEDQNYRKKDVFVKVAKNIKDAVLILNIFKTLENNNETIHELWKSIVDWFNDLNH